MKVRLIDRIELPIPSGVIQEVQIDLPANTTATVFLPAAAAAEVWEGNVPAAEAEGVTLIRQGNAVRLYALVSGAYAFEITV